MHHYPFHPSDYLSATAHLTDAQDLAYRRMIDRYYMTDKPLPENASQVARLIRMNDCLTDVEQVLNEFFTLCDDGWHQTRCDAVILEYAQRNESQRRAGRASAAARTLKQPETRTHAEQPLNQPVTSNQEPVTKNQEPLKTKAPRQGASQALLADYGVKDQQIIDDWLKLRKSKNQPVTKTALDGIAKQAEAAGLSLENALRTCCENGWAGFKAEWIAKAASQKNNDQGRDLSMVGQLTRAAAIEFLNEGGCHG